MGVRQDQVAPECLCRKIEYRNKAMTCCCLFPENNDSIEAVKYEVEQNTFEAESFHD